MSFFDKFKPTHESETQLGSARRRKEEMQYLIDGHGMAGLHPDELKEAEALGLSGERIHFSENEIGIPAILPTPRERERLQKAAVEFATMPTIYFDK